MSLMRDVRARSAGAPAPDPVDWVVASFTAAAGSGTRPTAYATAATYAGVRHHEDALGLPRGQLTAVLDQLARIREPRSAVPALARPLNPRWYVEAQELIEKALSSDRMTGIEWDDLSAELSRHADVVLRADDWQRLLARVIVESEVTIGLECTLRLEASARLAAHPRSAPHVTELARRAFDDPAGPMLYGVDLVRYSGDPETAGVLVRALADPAISEQQMWAAFTALEQIVRLEGLALEQRALAGLVAIDVLRDPSAPLRAHRGAASFLDALDPLTRQHLAAALRPDQRGRVAHVLEQGSVMSAEQREETARSVDLRLRPALGPRSAWAPPLRDLVDLAASSAYLEQRSSALEVLKLLPEGHLLGSAYAAELRDRWAAGDRVVADDLLGRLAWVVQRDDVPHLLELAVDPTLDPVTTRQAANAVGNAPPALAGHDTVSPSGVVARIAESAAARVATGTDRARSGSAGDGPVARGHCYALGLNGRFDLLEELQRQVDRLTGAADDTTRRRAADWATSLGWWLALPTWVRPLPTC